MSPPSKTCLLLILALLSPVLGACPAAPGGGGPVRRRGPDPPLAGADVAPSGAGAAPTQAVSSLPGVIPGELVPVPAGAFLMGSDEVPDEAPRRRVTLPGYLVERTEVTVAQYTAFVVGGGYDRRDSWSAEGWAWRGRDGARPSWADRSPDRPVVLVSFYEAQAYCRQAGRRLPSEAEWEKAARGADGRRFPWGDQRDPARSNHWSKKHAPPTTQDGSWPAASGRSGQSPHGVLHMAGNVWEWTASPYTRRSGSGTVSPWRVIRGGDWTSLLPSQRTSQREPARPGERRPTLGFRCAATPAGPEQGTAP